MKSQLEAIKRQLDFMQSKINQIEAKKVEHSPGHPSDSQNHTHNHFHRHDHFQNQNPSITCEPAKRLEIRIPRLKEVLENLMNPDEEIKLNASAYLQHLTYRDDWIKQQTRELGGIPKLIRLLSSENFQIQKNVCGCLRNLTFAEPDNQNKTEILKLDGVQAMAELLERNPKLEVIEGITGALWNMSSYDVSKTFS